MAFAPAWRPSAAARSSPPAARAAARSFRPDLTTATPIGRLTRRADFLRAAKGRKWHGRALSLQVVARDADPCEPADARVGFTLTKKVGNAVIRNRARRRLREALRLVADLPVRGDHDYVVIGRIEAIQLPFEALKSELARAVAGVHDPRGPKRRIAGPAKPRSERAGP